MPTITLSQAQEAVEYNIKDINHIPNVRKKV